MEEMKNYGSAKEEYGTKLLEYSCDARIFPRAQDRYFWRSFSEQQEDLLNETPRMSYYNPNLHQNLEIRLSNQHSFQKMASDYSSSRSTVSNEIPDPMTVTELVKEITTLELEIVHLEQYLLSLYRTAFDYHNKDFSNISGEYCRHSSGGMLTGKNTKLMVNHGKNGIKSDPSLGESNYNIKSIERDINLKLLHKESYSALHLQCDLENIANHVPGDEPEKNILEVGSDHLCDRDMFKETYLDPASMVPCKLSENILRCIAAIYCKLANIPKPQKDKVVLHASSFSFSSTISQQSSGGNCSPRYQHEAIASPSLSEVQKFEEDFYSDMIEIPRISIDGERFGYASKMLSIFRILVKQLKSIDPTKMANEEQIAFWLNIHNALVMHAFLAYGIHQGRMKSKSSILKAAYNIGGHSINAYVIRSSILGCQPNFKASWIEALLSPTLMFNKGQQRHLYALDHPQPLAYFALSQGSFSDPPVRVYTANHILRELELARKEFIQANVKVQNKTKIIFPKILCYYMKDCSFQIAKLLKMVIECMSETVQGAIHEFLKGKYDDCIVWSKYNSSFRYLIHKELARQ
ncbi:hypothetical protein KFK09_017183 [Dendrobium nobile]|uniref:DUF547 domain-containing protein n=1 Tax=Dendrobium nobile TaxID=94219 RepID=A0A8T3B0A9_DENNO|nr:hypothetical protein KFK09_017183 [Dendrobium nobile]